MTDLRLSDRPESPSDHHQRSAVDAAGTAEYAEEVPGLQRRSALARWRLQAFVQPTMIIPQIGHNAPVAMSVKASR